MSARNTSKGPDDGEFVPARRAVSVGGATGSTAVASRHPELIALLTWQVITRLTYYDTSESHTSERINPAHG